jgi:hypothetical protein
MAVESRCPDCGAAYGFTNDLTGQEVQCDECGNAFVIGLSTSNTKSNDGGKVEEGITTAAGQLQRTAPRLHPRVNDEGKPISRQSIAKKPGCSIVPIFVLLAVLLVGGGVVYISVFGYIEESREKEATAHILTWEDAVKIYYLDYQKYPQTLKELTETLPGDKPAIMVQSSLLDPWGQPYQYDPKNLDPRDKRPRIWSSGEPGARRPITNW